MNSKVQAFVSADLKKWLAMRARKEDRTVSKLVARILVEYRERTDALQPVTGD
jgi:hypothetical protein